MSILRRFHHLERKEELRPRIPGYLLSLTPAPTIDCIQNHASFESVSLAILVPVTSWPTRSASTTPMARPCGVPRRPRLAVSTLR